VRTEGLGLIGRMEADGYLRTTDRFRMSRLTLEEFSQYESATDPSD
jgi:hypothetical protein